MARPSRRQIPDVPSITIGAAQPTRCATSRTRTWFLVSDLAAAGAGAGRPTCRSLVADRAAAAAAHLVPAVADARSACGCGPCGESPVGGGVARRQRLPLQVRRRAGLRRPGRPRRRLPRDGRLQQLPRRPDRRPRLHRPGRDDLRQLAPRRPAARAPACSATPRRSACARAARRVHALLLVVAVLAARGRRAGSCARASGSPPRSSVVVGVADRRRLLPRSTRCRATSPA